MTGRTGIAPTIGGLHPGYGLRIRKDGPKTLAAADFNCACGDFAEDAIGDVEVEQLAVRAERHMRDDCLNPGVRAAAALRHVRRQQQTHKRRK